MRWEPHVRFGGRAGETHQFKGWQGAPARPNIIGAANRSAIVTLVERTSRFSLLGNLADGYSADAVLSCLVELFDRVPPELARTLTWDQGREMARHRDLALTSDLDVYFAEPHHPCQRATNENFNGLVRRYVGKGTDLSVYSQKDLDAISHRINTMPRRLHRWESAQDRYNAAIVALTGWTCRRSRSSDRAQNAVPERQLLPAWEQRRTARRVRRGDM